MPESEYQQSSKEVGGTYSHHKDEYFQQKYFDF